MKSLDFIIHLDKYLVSIIDLFGVHTYIILFAIIFAETGLVVFPFLPGDSLLFVVGTLAGSGFLNIWFVYFSLLLAAVLGDTVNYWIGHHFGARVFNQKKSRIFNPSHIEKTRDFFEKHGGKTIILARFLPIIRTFAPFVAGMGNMHYNTFLSYNIIGAVLWVSLLTFAGYFLGGLPIVKNNFEIAIFTIIGISLLPPIIEFVKHKKESGKTNFKEIQQTFKKEHLND